MFFLRSFWVRFFGGTILSFSLTFALQHLIVSNQIQTILGAASFVFGLFLTFFTVNAQNRLNTISSGLQAENGSLLFLSQASKVFPTAAQNKLRQMTDAYLMSQLDYRLHDYHLTESDFTALFDTVFTFKPTNGLSTLMHEKMLDELNGMMKNRQVIESSIDTDMERFEWINLLLLLGITVGCLLMMNDGSLTLRLVTSLLSSTAIMMMWTLYDMDKLHWQEERRIWIPLQRTLKDLGLLPYYPESALRGGRIKLQPSVRIRIARFPNAYPDLSGKTVKVQRTKQTLLA